MLDNKKSYTALLQFNERNVCLYYGLSAQTSLYHEQLFFLKSIFSLGLLFHRACAVHMKDVVKLHAFFSMARPPACLLSLKTLAHSRKYYADKAMSHIARTELLWYCEEEIVFQCLVQLTPQL